ncbi:hypothetical protein VTN00DRAFT_3984 [Thermoascus crustaceus]|uniref:uncharacterized protein n=1 Tax=Thermoascus crustaceus TaxID=5088 RepID=UPI00374232C5
MDDQDREIDSTTAESTEDIETGDSCPGTKERDGDPRGGAAPSSSAFSRDALPNPATRHAQATAPEEAGGGWSRLLVVFLHRSALLFLSSRTLPTFLCTHYVSITVDIDTAWAVERGSPPQTVRVLYSTSAAVSSTAVVENSHSLFPAQKEKKKRRGRPFINAINMYFFGQSVSVRLPKRRASSVESLVPGSLLSLCDGKENRKRILKTPICAPSRSKEGLGYLNGSENERTVRLPFSPGHVSFVSQRCDRYA